MVGSSFSRVAAMVACVALGLVLMAAPVAAQTSEVKGRVIGPDGKPIEGAQITIASKDGTSQFKTVSRAKGEFSQARVPHGEYILTATAGKLTQSYAIEVKGNLDLDVKIESAEAAASKEDAARRAKIQGLFAEGAKLSNEGKLDEALAKFEEVLAEIPQCGECYTNMGAIHMMKDDAAAAEEHYKKAIAINPELVEAYNGLASLYNSQKRYKEAQLMGAEAAKRGTAAGGGGSAAAFFNQAVILWNSPDADPDEVHDILAKAIQADPNHAEAHFLMGNVLVKQGASSGDMAKFAAAADEFEAYLKLAPNGPNADKARESFEQLKVFRK